MRKRAALHIFGIIGLLIIGDFWVRYYRFCRFNTVASFNEFVHNYTFAADQLIILMVFAIIAGAVAAFTNKLWLLTSILALATLLFVFSQIT